MMMMNEDVSVAWVVGIASLNEFAWHELLAQYDAFDCSLALNRHEHWDWGVVKQVQQFGTCGTSLATVDKRCSNIWCFCSDIAFARCDCGPVAGHCHTVTLSHCNKDTVFVHVEVWTSWGWTGFNWDGLAIVSYANEIIANMVRRHWSTIMIADCQEDVVCSVMCSSLCCGRWCQRMDGLRVLRRRAESE